MCQAEQNCSQGSIDALIDSVASSNVTGIGWLDKYASISPHQWQKCYTAIKKRFRFGDGIAAISLGTLVINARIKCCDEVYRPYLILTGVVKNRAPLLIGRLSLQRMHGRIDPQSNILHF